MPSIQEIYSSPACSVFQLAMLTDNYTYILRDHHEQKTGLIDAAEAEPVISFLEARGWSLDAIFNTHHHADHIGGNARLRALYPCTIYASAYDADRGRIAPVDRSLNEGDVVSCGSRRLEVLATPGHTLGHIVYFMPEEKILFCGDTLFVLGCGRLFEGSAATMWESLSKLSRLPPETLICCAHEYTLANARFTEQLGHLPEGYTAYRQGLEERRAADQPTVPSRLSEELMYNPFLRAADPNWAAALGRGQAPGAALFAQLRREKDHSR